MDSGETPEPGADDDGRHRLSRLLKSAAAVAAFTFEPVLGFVNHNREDVALSDVIVYPLVTTVVALAFVALIDRLRSTRAAVRAAILISAGVYVFTRFNAVDSALRSINVTRGLVALAVWGAGSLVLLGLVYVVTRRHDLLNAVIVAAVVVVAVPLWQVITDAPDVTLVLEPDDEAAPSRPFTETPDIYYFMVDGYARADELSDGLGFDNSEFLDALRDRGFHVADAAAAPYWITHLSVPSTLEMRYLVEPGDAVPEKRKPLYDIISGGSTVVTRLRDEGYRYVHATPGTWQGSRCSGSEDLCIPTATGWSFGEVELGLLRLTPIPTLLERLVPSLFRASFVDPVEAVEATAQAPRDGPSFTFVHLLHTHPPLALDERCNEVATAGGHLGDQDQRRDVYVDTVQCANGLLLDAIAAAPSDAIVVVQSDHGPAFGLDYADAEAWTADDVRQRMGVLSAIRLPQPCLNDLGSSFAGVNTFRAVFACLEGREPDLLPQRSFLPTDEGSVMEVDVPVVVGDE